MAERRTSRLSRGSSFVEVLLAMTIMAIVLVGILQMFSVSLIINKGSAARTQMLFKCQQVVENLRWYYYVSQRTLATLPTNTGIPALAATTVDLPYTSADASWGFWGPQGANVMEIENGPYKIRYVIEQDAAQSVAPGVTWVITVTAFPTDVPGAKRYFGVSTAGSGKRVDYVAEFVQ